MDILLQAMLAFVATACFGVIFNAPTKVIPYCGLIGSLGWALYYLLTNYATIDMVQATFVSAFFVALLASLYARRKRMPVIVFSVSGIIPLVPGGTAYNTMRNIVEQDYNMGVQNGMLVFMISGAIAMGLVFSEVIMQVLFSFFRIGRTSISSFMKQKAHKKMPSKFNQK